MHRDEKFMRGPAPTLHHTGAGRRRVLEYLIPLQRAFIESARQRKEGSMTAAPTEQALCTCCEPRRPITRPISETNSEEWWHDDDEQLATVIHAHVTMSSRDCDGAHGHDYVTRPAPLTRVDGADEHAFRTEMLEQGLPLHLNDDGATIITITADRATWGMDTDEGGASGEIRFCTDPDCADERSTNYDQFAEAAGY